MRTNTISRAVAALDAGMTTAAELVEQSLKAIDAHGSATNAFTQVDAAGARAAAESADRERAAGRRRGPLHGIPISLKDIIDVAGVVTTAASRVLSDRVPTVDAPVVSRLRAAGTIIIGRTNLHEFAFGTTSEFSAFGPVRHPLDPSRSAGGSSGGSAAAVATGMGLASIGTDTGGSIRIPAGLCGLVGLKATIGEIPTSGVIPLSQSLDHVGPLSNSVQDAAWLYAAMAGVPLATLAPAATNGLRLKRLRGYFAGPFDSTVAGAFERAIGVLEAAGASIGDGEVPSASRVGEIYTSIVLPEATAWHTPYLDTRANGYTESVRSRLLLGRSVPAIDYLGAVAARPALTRELDALFDDADALVLPTLPIVAPPLGAETVAIGSGAAPVPVRGAMLRHTQLFNLTGHPAITLPIPSPGLPVGLELVGRCGMTMRLLEIAAGCEAALDTSWR